MTCPVTAKSIVFTWGLLSLAFTIACWGLSAVCGFMARLYIGKTKFSTYSWLMLIRRYGAAAKRIGGPGALWFHCSRGLERLAWIGFYSLALSIVVYVSLTVSQRL